MCIHRKTGRRQGGIGVSGLVATRAGRTHCMFARLLPHAVLAFGDWLGSYFRTIGAGGNLAGCSCQALGTTRSGRSGHMIAGRGVARASTAQLAWGWIRTGT